tara:strand:+ start:12 stop:935 length:924 start_codon:yes stop_codon:yes gene_type:complete
MNYYDLLNVPRNATTEGIKKHYHKYAKMYHPDKGGNPELFKQINEAYTILMNPIQRHEYDMELTGNNYSFTKEDYEIIFSYYNSFINSVEVRLMMALFYKLPKNVRKKTDLTSLFKKKSCSKTLIHIHNIKYIDATQLYDNITLHLKRSLEDVFNRVLKQIIVKTRTTYYHLFIIDSDYNIYLYNDSKSIIQIELMTLSNNNFYKKGYDLYYIKNIDLYEYYYGSTFSIRLPNHYNICCIANNLMNKKISCIDTFGFYDPMLKGRGNLKIIYQLIHNSVHEYDKQLIKKIFHKKDICMDPSYPIYRI